MSQPIAKAARVPFSFQESEGREERLPLTLLQVQARRVTKRTTWSLRQIVDVSPNTKRADVTSLGEAISPPFYK